MTLSLENRFAKKFIPLSSGLRFEFFFDIFILTINNIKNLQLTKKHSC